MSQSTSEGREGKREGGRAPAPTPDSKHDSEETALASGMSGRPKSQVDERWTLVDETYGIAAFGPPIGEASKVEVVPAKRAEEAEAGRDEWRDHAHDGCLDLQNRAKAAEADLARLRERVEGQISAWERRADKNKSRVWLRAATECRAALEPPPPAENP